MEGRRWDGDGDGDWDGDGDAAPRPAQAVRGAPAQVLAPETGPVQHCWGLPGRRAAFSVSASRLTNVTHRHKMWTFSIPTAEVISKLSRAVAAIKVEVHYLLI